MKSSVTCDSSMVKGFCRKVYHSWNVLCGSEDEKRRHGYGSPDVFLVNLFVDTLTTLGTFLPFVETLKPGRPPKTNLRNTRRRDQPVNRFQSSCPFSSKTRRSARVVRTTKRNLVFSTVT